MWQQLTCFQSKFVLTGFQDSLICPFWIYSRSQCSTVVRNTVVRATNKVCGKSQILGTSSPQTLESIDLKFDLDDYVGGLTLRAKNGTNRPSRVGGAKG